MTAQNGKTIDLIRRVLAPPGVVAFCRGRALEALAQPVSAETLGSVAEILRTAAKIQAEIEREAKRAREERVMRAVTRRYWREQEKTYRLMAVIFGEDAGKVRHRGGGRMTYGKAMMFASFMALSA